MSGLKTTIKMAGREEWKALVERAEHVIKDEAPDVIAAAATKACQDHLDMNYVGKPNQLGGTSTGYWTNVRNSAEGKAEEKGVTVSLTGVGLLMKFTGGVVKPTGRVSSVTGKPIRFLSIPVHAMAHGKVPAEFGKRLYVHGFAGGAGRSEGDSAQGAGLFLKQGAKADDSDPLLFWLTRSATIKADKNIFPPEATTAAECVAAVTALIDSKTQTA